VLHLTAMLPLLPSLILAAAPPENLCQGRGPCFVESVADAGTDGQDRALQVAHLVLGAKDAPWAEPGMFGDPCTPHEYWLIVDGAVRPQRLLRLCNDGYGAAGMGEDTVTVSANRLVHAQNGGSAWRWSTTHEIRLSPLTLLSEAESGFWTMGSNSERSAFSWTAFAGDESWFSPVCDDEGNPPDHGIGMGSEAPEIGYVLVPQLAALPDVDWPSTALGACAAAIDSAGARRFVVHGAPGAADDAAMKVLMTGPREIVVEVSDDRWASGAASWLHDDHLELWVADRRPAHRYGEHCLEEDQSDRQWGIRVADGEVFAAHGDPPVPPAVTVARAAAGPGTTARLVIRLPGDFEAVTVVYSDSDDGKSQERLIATSPVKFGRSETLGSFQLVPPAKASCVERDGALAVQPVSGASVVDLLSSYPEE